MVNLELVQDYRPEEGETDLTRDTQCVIEEASRGYCAC